MSRQKLQITNHAIHRWQQRIAKVSEAEAVAGILAALATAKEKHFKPQKLEKMTFVIPAPGVLLIGSRSKIVTVLERAEDARYGLVDVDDEEIKCEGFTRPECLPCPSTSAENITYLCMGIEETKPLCPACAAKILTGEPRGWH